MTTARSERPSYFEGQYIGAADLEAAVDYARELSREAALAGQSWGICIGLDLVEIANASGGFDYYVLPGLAFDGYGRPIVVLAPAPVPPALFASLPSGNQRVWLRYDQKPFQGLRPGWQTCNSSDSYARVQESYAIEVGAFSAVKDRQSGVTVAGALVEDARLALNSVDADAPLVCDASIPHQQFPEDSARWLVPVGAAAWTSGSPGNLGERTADGKKQSRVLRRYAGQIAESVYAADGVLRLRDRFTDRDPAQTPDDQCSASSITTDDITNAVDPTDSSKKLDRLIGNELVWVEGNMRVTGDARLWGTKLEFRDAKGTTAKGKLYLQRGATDNVFGGADLNLAIGDAEDGKSRLLAGAVAADGTFSVALAWRNNGQLAIGGKLKDDFKSYTILAAGIAGASGTDTAIAVAAPSAGAGKLVFTSEDLTDLGHIGFDTKAKRLRLGAGTDLAKFVYMTPDGQVGIRTDKPEQLETLGGGANDLVVSNPNSVGMTLLSGENQIARINFADGTDDAAHRQAGSIIYYGGSDWMEFVTATDVRMTITGSGNVGIGETYPDARLQVASLSDAHNLRVNPDHLQARNGGSPSQLGLQPYGGGILVNGTMSGDQQMTVDSSGRIGIGTTAPSAPFHARVASPRLRLEPTGSGRPGIDFAIGGSSRGGVELDTGSEAIYLRSNGSATAVASGSMFGVNIGESQPVTNLHVRGNINGDAGFVESHVAYFENVSGGSADVLALKVNVAAPDGSNNFITFFGANGPVGRIEGSGGGNITMISGGADFAECLRREDAEPIGPGRVVGVRAGIVSLSTEGAESVLVTTDRAIVLGNAPQSGEEGWERVAMLGQVPVEVEGPVTAGDFIVASGRGDGIGLARPATAMRGDELVVGRAWQGSTEQGTKRVLTAIGIDGARRADALTAVIAAQQTAIARLEARVAALAGD